MKYLLLFLVVQLGYVIGNKVFKKDKYISLLLVFSAGFLLTIAMKEVFPVVFSSSIHYIGAVVILGVLLQIVLEYFSKGVEHGHLHLHNTKQIPTTLIFGLFLHAFLEGTPLLDHHHSLEYLWLAIALHKIPIAILFATLVAKLEISSKIKYSILILFAAITPLGMWVGTYLSESLKIYALALNGGIFLHISSLIIFESNKNHSFNIKKFGILLIGIILAFLI